jgi:hypothetical protein
LDTGDVSGLFLQAAVFATPRDAAARVTLRYRERRTTAARRV